MKIISIKLVICLLILSSFSGYSQNATSDKSNQNNSYIEVLGTATQEVKPDKIDLSILLSEKNNTTSENNLEKQEQNLKKILSQMSVPSSQLTLADIASEIIKEKRKDETIQRTKEYYLRLSSAEQVSAILAKLAESNIKEVKIISIDHSKIDSIRKEVRIAAIKAAKDKAIYLTTAIDEKIEKALEIREEPTVYRYTPFAQLNMANSTLNDAEPDAGKSEPNFKTFTVKYSIYIKYALR
jgi:uncharacterized protein YggE